MKKGMKCLAAAAGITGAVAITNRIILRRANVNPRSRFESLMYKWRMGNIRYVCTGKGEPVLMIHGLDKGSSLLEWEEQMSLLSKRYRVYAMDLLGYGASAKPNITYSSYLYVSLINDFIADVIGSPTNLVAVSESAAFTVAGCAIKPELYNKLMLVSPTGIGTTHRRVTFFSKLCSLAALDMPVYGTAIYNILSSRIMLRLFLRVNGALYSAQRVSDRYYSAHYNGYGGKYALAARLSNILSVDLRLVLRKADLPIHVCWGWLNNGNPLSNFGLLRSINDDIGLTVCKDSGLLPHVTQPKLFYRMCRNFFD